MVHGTPVVDGEALIPAERLQAFIFDTDGVVTDTARVHAAAWRRLFDEYLAGRVAAGGEPFQPFQEQDYLLHIDGRPRFDGVVGFLASRGITVPYGRPADPPGDQITCALGNRKDGYFLELLRAQGVRAFPSTVALTRALRARGVRTAAVSSSRNCAAVLAAAGVADLFDVRVDGMDSARLGLTGNTPPALFLEAARR